MKHYYFILALLFTSFSFGQQVVFTSGEDKSNVVSTIPSIETADFEIYAHLLVSDEKQKEIFEDFDGIQTELMINDHLIETSGFIRVNHLFSFQDEGEETFHKKPSLQSEIPLKEILQSNGKLMIQNGNVLKINYLFKGEVIGSGSCSFTIEEFKNPNGDFCNLKAPYLTTEPTLIASITAEFTAKNPTHKAVKVWLPYALLLGDEGVEETSGFVLYLLNGDYGMIKYSVTRENGKITATPDTFSEVRNLHPDCVKLFLENE